MDMDPYHVILRPHTSERTHDYLEECETYVFEVHPKATKTDIRGAIEKIWGVKVKSVRTMNLMGKHRRMGRHVGRTRNWKKALVRLHADQAIEILR